MKKTILFIGVILMAINSFVQEKDSLSFIRTKVDKMGCRYNDTLTVDTTGVDYIIKDGYIRFIYPDAVASRNKIVRDTTKRRE